MYNTLKVLTKKVQIFCYGVVGPWNYCVKEYLLCLSFMAQDHPVSY